MASFQNCSRRLLLALSLVPVTGCCKRQQPQGPQVLTVREPCLALPPPVPLAQEIRDCLSLGNDLADCSAHAATVREVWISAAIAECGK